MVSLLIEASIDAADNVYLCIYNKQLRDDFSPFYFIILHRNAPVVCLLLKNGANFYKILFLFEPLTLFETLTFIATTSPLHMTSFIYLLKSI